MWKQRLNRTFPDLFAGVTGALAGAPQAMGFAILTGISPLYGLYAATFPTIIGALTTRTWFMTVAPTNTLALIVGGALMAYDGPQQLEALFTLTLLVGAVQMVLGFLRFGALTRFVSNAVMVGFVSGAAVLIVIGQIDHLSGLSAPDTQEPLLRLWDWLTRVPTSDGPTLTVGVLTIVLILTLHRTVLKYLATPIAIVITSGLAALAGWDSVKLVRDMADVSAGLPEITLPVLRLVPSLIGPALAVAIFASVQSAAITVIGKQHAETARTISRDMIGQGLANMAGGLLQSMPSTGSLSRTAVNLSAGARTRGANLIAGLLILLIVVLLGPWIEHIALAALAGHLIVAAIRLIDWREIGLVWRVQWSARLVLAVTFVSTLVLPLQYSIYLGVLLSLAMYVNTSSSNLKVVRLVPTPDQHFREELVGSRLPDHSVVIFSVSGNLYFAALKRLEELLPPADQSRGTIVILRLRDNQYLGSTGIHFIYDYAQSLRANGGRLILSGIGSSIRQQLERTGAIDMIGRENIFYADDVLLAATERALAFAQTVLRPEA